MMATLRSFMLALSASGNGGSAISPENRDPLFPDHAQNPGFHGRSNRPKRKPGQKWTGHAFTAAQYSQERSKNNDLFGFW
jgi:hypothetical protein